MAKNNFSTDRQVATLSPLPGQKQTEYHHKSEAGLILRVGLKKKSWAIKYTLDGRRKKYTLPQDYPNIGLADAIKECKRIRSEADKGKDPLGKKQSWKEAPTVCVLMEFYFENNEMAAKSRTEGERINKKDILPIIGDMKATELTRVAVKSLHKGIADRGAKVAANRTVELLRRAYNCAFEEELITHNPFPNLKKIKASEAPRERILKDSEIKILWEALEAESPNMRDVLRLLLLLGQRSTETMSMAVCDIDQETKEWTVPAIRTKNGKPNVLPLPPLAWGIIEPRLNNEKWIFPSAYNTTRKVSRGDGHTKSTNDARRRLRAATGIDGWTGHDLRRTCRTIMAREGVLPHIAEQVLGHIQGGVEAIYDQHSYLKEKRAALEKVSNSIGKVLGIPREQAKIIKIERAV